MKAQGAGWRGWLGGVPLAGVRRRVHLMPTSSSSTTVPSASPCAGEENRKIGQARGDSRALDKGTNARVCSWPARTKLLQEGPRRPMLVKLREDSDDEGRTVDSTDLHVVAR